MGKAWKKKTEKQEWSMCYKIRLEIFIPTAGPLAARESRRRACWSPPSLEWECLVLSAGRSYWLSCITLKTYVDCSVIEQPFNTTMIAHVLGVTDVISKWTVAFLKKKTVFSKVSDFSVLRRSSRVLREGSHAPRCDEPCSPGGSWRQPCMLGSRAWKQNCFWKKALGFSWRLESNRLGYLQQASPSVNGHIAEDCFLKTTKLVV